MSDFAINYLMCAFGLVALGPGLAERVWDYVKVLTWYYEATECILYQLVVSFDDSALASGT
jgi:hypothetical protein